MARFVFVFDFFGALFFFFFFGIFNGSPEVSNFALRRYTERRRIVNNVRGLLEKPNKDVARFGANARVTGARNNLRCPKTVNHLHDGSIA